MIQKLEEPSQAASLFSGWNETMIWSCLQGIMGAIYVSGSRAALALLGDFTFFAGEPDPELVSFRPEADTRDFLILVPPDEAWSRLIEAIYGEKAHFRIRYAMKKEPDVFDRNRLNRLASSLPDGVEIRMIDEEIYYQCRREEWSRDQVSLYPDYETYQKLGLGAAALKDGKLIAGASSYSRYRDGIEIQIDTRADFRRQGLATACGARLILECLDRGIYPSWDAQNRWSMALAEKLGYHFDYEYGVYDIW